MQAAEDKKVRDVLDFQRNMDEQKVYAAYLTSPACLGSAVLFNMTWKEGRTTNIPELSAWALFY